jgi:RNA polymerase sigma-70 factor (ECF subfamily)
MESSCLEPRLPPLTHDPEEPVLVAAAQRDPARFAELYERHFDRVYAYVSRRVPERFGAEDVTADVFRHALANLHRFEWRGTPFVAWLLRIAANTITDHWRRTRREQPILESHDPAPAAVPPEHLDDLDRRALLFRLVRALPPDQRRVLEMRFAEEQPIKEIARELHRSPGAIKQLQFRAIQSLRVMLQDSQLKKPGEANA